MLFSASPRETRFLLLPFARSAPPHAVLRALRDPVVSPLFLSASVRVCPWPNSSCFSARSAHILLLLFSASLRLRARIAVALCGALRTRRSASLHFGVYVAFLRVPASPRENRCSVFWAFYPAHPYYCKRFIACGSCSGDRSLSSGSAASFSEMMGSLTGHWMPISGSDHNTPPSSLGE